MTRARADAPGARRPPRARQPTLTPRACALVPPILADACRCLTLSRRRRQAALYFASYQQQRQSPARADASALKAGAAHLAADADVVRALVAEVATVLDSAKFGEALAVRACHVQAA